jgi:hypothetical protein
MINDRCGCRVGLFKRSPTVAPARSDFELRDLRRTMPIFSGYITKSLPRPGRQGRAIRCREGPAWHDIGTSDLQQRALTETRVIGRGEVMRHCQPEVVAARVMGGCRHGMAQISDRLTGENIMPACLSCAMAEREMRPGIGGKFLANRT